MTDKFDPTPNTEKGYKESYASAYYHYSGDTALIASMFHQGFGVLAGEKKSEVGESQAVKASLEELKEGFITRMKKAIDDTTLHDFGGVTKEFMEQVVRTAKGDWNDPAVIKELMDQRNSVRDSSK